jgi:hypothetical protein
MGSDCRSATDPIRFPIPYSRIPHSAGLYGLCYLGCRDESVETLPVLVL